MEPPTPEPITPRQRLYLYLVGVFLTALLIGDTIGSKLFTVDLPLGFTTLPATLSVGSIWFPITFLLTDVVNDFYGRKGARFLTLLGFAMALLAYALLQLTTSLPVHESTYFTQAEYAKIFGGSAQLFIASMIAFLVGQFLDIHVFQFWKALTSSRHLWLRATGSTLLSQIVDTVMINVIFWTWTASSDPSSFLGRMAPSDRHAWIFAKIEREYLIKMLVAILLTPVVYGLHGAIVKWLGIQPEVHEKRPTRPGR